LNTNRDFPFAVKRKVVEAAFNASILYGCESWLNVNCNIMNSLYLGAIKMLLGVRSTTTNDACLIEAGFPPLQSLIKEKQSRFFRKMLQQRSDMEDDPFMFVYELTCTGNRRMSRYIADVMNTSNHADVGTVKLKESISASQRSKLVTYNLINNDLKCHDVYSSLRPMNRPLIPEIYRIAFSRFRLSSHRLRIESGRWARLARHERLCRCGLVQDEEHVLCNCPFTQSLRDAYGKHVVFPDILSNTKECADFKFLCDVLKVFE
jgi:hypothetical protein